jgi:hypothetical protein
VSRRASATCRVFLERDLLRGVLAQTPALGIRWPGMIPKLTGGFGRRIAKKISVGGGLAYLWATLPPLFIDRSLTHNVRYPYAREYPGAIYYIIPVSIATILITYIWMRKRKSILAGLCPFALALTGSMPIFRPEFPHGQLLHAGGLWLVVGGLTLWIHTLEIGDKSESSLRSNLIDKIARVEYLKEELQYWRTILLVIAGGYIALVLSWVNFAIQYNKELVGGNASEAFVLDTLAISGITLCSIAVLVGPIAEATKRHRKALSLFLTIKESTEVTS